MELNSCIGLCFETTMYLHFQNRPNRISGLVVEYIVAIDVTRVRFLADAFSRCTV